MHLLIAANGIGAALTLALIGYLSGQEIVDVVAARLAIADFSDVTGIYLAGTLAGLAAHLLTGRTGNSRIGRFASALLAGAGLTGFTLASWLLVQSVSVYLPLQ